MSQERHPEPAPDPLPLRRKLVKLLLCFVLVLVGIWLGDQQDGRLDPLHRPVFASRFDAWLDWFRYPIERNGFLRPSYMEQNLTDVAMSEDGVRLWVVASRGKIIASTDSGRHWRNLISGTDANLAAIAMAEDGLCGWAVGDGGVVLRTEDGGGTWRRQPIDTARDLYTVSMAGDCSHGWIGGTDLVLYTEDGGAHWIRSRLPETNAGGYIAGRAASTGQVGILIHQGYGLRKTEDRGASWSPLDDVATRDFEDAAISGDGMTIWGVGARGTLSRSTDGGRTWRQSPLPFSGVLVQIAMSPDGRRGVMTDKNGRLRVTADGAQSWTSADNPLSGLNAVKLSRDGRHGVAVGPGNIITTDDSGETWRLRTRGQGRIYSIFIEDGGTIWAAGEGPTLLKSEDRGRTWSPQTARDEPWLLDSRTLRGFHMAPDGKRGWVAGDDNIFWTYDGGRSWSANPVPDIAWITGFVGFADGESWLGGPPVGRLVHVKRDQSRDKTAQLTDFSLDALAVSDDRRKIWAAGRGGSMVRSDDGGSSWQTSPIPSGEKWIRALAMRGDGLRGCAVGIRGALLVTADGGATWTAKDPGTGAALNAVILGEDRRGWIVGNRGTLLATEDGGESWHRKEAPFHVSITAIAMKEDGFGVIGGFGRNLALTEDGGKTWIWSNSYGLDRAPWVYAWIFCCLAAATWILVRPAQKIVA